MATTESNSDDRVERAVQGDLDALEELLREVTPAIAASLSIDPLWSRSFDVDDVLQVSYLEAYLRIPALQNATLRGFQVWLKRIAGNNLKDAIRALERDKRPDARQRVTQGPEGQSARTLLLSVTGRDATAGGQLAEREEIARLRSAISDLPDSYRRVVEGVDLDERPIREVADELQRSVGAVHMLRSRAHDRLREQLRLRSI